MGALLGSILYVQGFSLGGDLRGGRRPLAAQKEACEKIKKDTVQHILASKVAICRFWSIPTLAIFHLKSCSFTW